MKTKSTPRFDINALRKRAGEKVFARGEDYHRDGHVVLLAVEQARVLAQVEGSEDYRVELNGQGKAIGGDCSCPAFEDWGVCKHMVATALAVNSAGSEGEEAVGALTRIREHLKKKDVKVLVEMIVELAADDPALFRRLDLSATASLQGSQKDIERRLLKLINDATRIRDYVEYSEARDWADGVRSALDAVAAFAQDGQAALALNLSEHAIDRLEGVMGSIDDSDGHCGGLLEHARDIHLAAAMVVRPDPVELARNLFTRETESDYDTFNGAADHYEDMLGEAGLAEYRRLAAAAWEKLPSRAGKVRSNNEPQGDYHTLMHILDFFAERDGDTETRIALRTKDLTSPWDYLQLAEFCLVQGRKDEALRRAEEGLWLFEDDKLDERLVLFTAKLMLKAGRKGDTQALLRRAFEKSPSFELYKQLVKLGGNAARESAVKLLEVRMTGDRRKFFGHPAGLLVDILIYEKSFDAAWAAVRKHGASTYTEDELAKASEKTHPREALAVYAKRVERYANTGGNDAYGQAAKLVARMASLQGAAEQAAYIIGLKQRFEHKRNFMKLLG